MKHQIFNPYLPAWEYIPDGEPHVFGDRVYIYGSHDIAHGWVFCLEDYVCYSAPVNDLTDWRYEGVIYPRVGEDPINNEGKMCLYAPDVTQGPDGRYYLYYVYDKVSVISVAVCDTPCGKFKHYGYVHYKDGTRLGERQGDEPQFDPGVITEGDKTYLYGGFCSRGDKSRTGAHVVTLDKDMVTIIEEPVRVVPGCMYSEGSGFEGHEYFEAASIRKNGDTYYFVYSSIVMHELCYATSKNPREGFKYGGVIVSNCDMHIDTYKPADMPTAYGANNHGSIEKIGDDWYIFYHRQTNGTWYSRQACAEKIKIEADGKIPQVEITSCGLNGGPLVAMGEYPAHIACHIFNTDNPSMYVGGEKQARITTDGRKGDEVPSYVAGITNNTTVGFKYFDYTGKNNDGKKPTKLAIRTRGYAGGKVQVKTKWDGEVLGEMTLHNTNFWEEYECDVKFPDEVGALYLTYSDAYGGNWSLLSVEFK